ncbi:MAG: DUF342 domain-containing protein [Candidatus Syntropharchaeia archaeon]
MSVKLIKREENHYLEKDTEEKVSYDEISQIMREIPVGINRAKVLRLLSLQSTYCVNISRTTRIENIDIEVEDDASAAYITIEEYETYPEVDDILYALAKAKVCFGIDINAIKEIVNSAVPVERVVVASGKKPIDGKDGYIEYFISPPTKKPRMKKDGTVDYYSLDLFTTVKPGDIIARVHPPTQAINGISVLGKKIPAHKGKKAPIYLEKGVKLVDDEIISETMGVLRVFEDTIWIEECLTINGDVSLSTGNIEFDGNIRITGWVRSGLFVSSKAGSVEILGGIENAKVRANKDISIRLGVMGGDNTSLDAGGSVYAEFIQNAAVKAGKNIVVNKYIYNCQVIAGQRINIDGKNGTVMDSDVSAKTAFTANKIKGTPSSIRIKGMDRKSIVARLQNLSLQRLQVEKKLRHLTLNVKGLKEDKSRIEELQVNIDRYLDLRERLDNLKSRTVELEEILKEIPGDAFVSIRKNETEPLRIFVKNRIVTLGYGETAKIFYDPETEDITWMT